MYMYMYVYVYMYIYVCVYVCIDIYTHKKIFIKFARTASRNVYFQLTQEDFLSFSQNTFVYLYMYICILTVFEDYSMCLLHYI